MSCVLIWNKKKRNASCLISSWNTSIFVKFVFFFLFFFRVVILSHRVRGSLRDSCQAKVQKEKKKKEKFWPVPRKFVVVGHCDGWVIFFSKLMHILFLISSYYYYQFYLFSFILSILWIYVTSFRIDCHVWTFRLSIIRIRMWIKVYQIFNKIKKKKNSSLAIPAPSYPQSSKTRIVKKIWSISLVLFFFFSCVEKNVVDDSGSSLSSISFVASSSSCCFFFTRVGMMKQTSHTHTHTHKDGWEREALSFFLFHSSRNFPSPSITLTTHQNLVCCFTARIFKNRIWFS